MKSLVGWGICLALLAAGPHASADDKASCLDANSKGQTFRDAHKLIEARDQFRICARSSCPGVLQKDCATWLDEVERMLPSVVFAFKDGAGQDVVDARVSEANKVLATTLDGTAIAMNPGVHTFQFQLADGTRVEQRTVVREGQKALTVTAVGPKPSGLSKAVPPSPGLPASSSPSPSPSALKPDRPGATDPAPNPTGSSGHSSHTWAYVAGGIGLAGIAVGSVAGILALGKKQTADGHCTGAECEPVGTEAGNSGRGLADVATVGFGAGIAGLALGTVLWVLAPGRSSEQKAEARTWQTGFAPLSSGGLFVSTGRSW